MGLCKCPQRKVTNQFCFEHRVNVCEHCMVNRHQKVGAVPPEFGAAFPDFGAGFPEFYVVPYYSYGCLM